MNEVFKAMKELQMVSRKLIGICFYQKTQIYFKKFRNGNFVIIACLVFEHVGKFSNTNRYVSYRVEKLKKKVHWPGIGPGSPAWQASILPLNHQCLFNIFF